MAKLPKIYFNGVRVKTFKYNGVEVFEGTFKDPNTNKVVCYHKHRGTAGQSTPQGCYTKKTAYGGSCGGHEETEHYATHCKCGAGLPCGNPVCGYRGDNGYGGEDWQTRVVTKYCTTPGCSNWNWQYRYDLNCGYDAE